MNNSKSTEAEFLAAKRIVQAKARKEYEDFLDSYKRMGADERFEKMVEDSGKISFFRSVFIQVSILGRLDPWHLGSATRADFLAEFDGAHPIFDWSCSINGKSYSKSFGLTLGAIPVQSISAGETSVTF